jgi:hypothetical protein
VDEAETLAEDKAELGEKREDIDVVCEAAVELAGLGDDVVLSEASQKVADAESMLSACFTSLTSPVVGFI